MEIEDEAPKRLANFSFAAKSAGAIALLCLIVGQSAEQYAAALPPTWATATFASSNLQSNASGVDGESVGSIRIPSAAGKPCSD